MALVSRANPQGVPSPAGKYSQLSIVENGGRTVSFAGQVGADKVGHVPGDVAAQAELVFNAIEKLLESQHSTPAEIVTLSTFLVGRENLSEFNRVRDTVYAQWFPSEDFPPNTLLFVHGLATEALLVEISGSFVCPATT
jgi:2-iminobutanoate/2-iminopropanoate deaminase